ncbi:MAG: hypothetical protein FD129_1484 [bacterium]|nr:MAG: hypothetical protein FD129_1484 [bacterium]
MEGSFTPPTIAGSGGSGFSGGPPPMPPPPTPPPTPPPVAPFPWEEPGRSIGSALFETIRLIVTSPSEAFARMPLNSELLRPVLFALIVGMIGVVAQTVYETLFSAVFTRLLPMFADKSDAMFGAVGGVIGLFFAPFFIPLFLAIGAGITHLMLMLLGGGRQGWTATFRVASYSMVSSLFMLIPIAGGLLNFVASLIFQTHGLAVVHGMSRGRAFVALFLPLIVCCGCFMLGMLVFGTAMLAGFKDLWNQ